MQITEAERAAAMRFCETCEDDEGYDVPKPMMKRLSELGLVLHHPFGRFSGTPALDRLKRENDAGVWDEFQIIEGRPVLPDQQSQEVNDSYRHWVSVTAKACLMRWRLIPLGAKRSFQAFLELMFCLSALFANLISPLLILLSPVIAPFARHLHQIEMTSAQKRESHVYQSYFKNVQFKKNDRNNQ